MKKHGMHTRGMKKVRGAVAVVAVLLGVFLLLAQPVQAQSSDTAGSTAMTKVRLAHLSPDTPAMDIYAAGADGIETKVLSSLAYRDVSEYVGVPVGFYAFTMRPAGAPATDPAALSATALLEGGEAFTFAAFGPGAEIQTQLIKDDLQSPGPRKTAVRVFQASPELGTVSIEVADGPEIYSDLAAGQATEYVDLTAGQRQIIITPTDPTVAAVEASVDLPAGGVVTLIVGGKSGAMGVMTVVDASGTDLTATGASSPVMPTGGIDAGGGGLAGLSSAPGAGSGSGSPSGFLVVIIAGGVVLSAAASTAIVRRRTADVRA